ncbi:hypothetical protein RQP46_004238 [Phenoliferia psychrophenolica]
MSMASSYRSISDRLILLETRLGRDEEQRSDSPTPSSPPSELEDHFALDLVGEASNPVQVVVEEMSRIEARTNELNLADDSGARKIANPCDPLLRGLVSVEEVELAFGFFLERIQPWTDTLARESDRRPLELRTKSPFLFCVILLVTNCASILSPSAAELNTEFILALILLVHYKPVQHISFYSRGIYDSAKIVHSSKVNPFSSMMIHGLMHRTASFLGLPLSPQAYLSANTIANPIPPAHQLRVWYWLCISDVHGSLQSGRPCQTDLTSALTTTRQFAKAKVLPSDPRRAATLESYAIAATPVYAGSTSKIRLLHLQRMADEFERWNQYWPPVLEHAQRHGDPLAYTCMATFNFVTLSTMSVVFTRWSNDRRMSIEEGGQGRPSLSSGDWRALQRAADACEAMVYSVSRESEQGVSSIRSGKWPESPDQGYLELTLDPRVVFDYTTGLDTVYALLLLVKMASVGLISCDLRCLRTEYEAGGAGLEIPQGLDPGRKLPRLLLLGSQFLKGISPQPEHPAFKHGELLELILEAGLGEHTPHLAPPATPFPHVAIPISLQADVQLPRPVGPVQTWLDTLGATSPTVRKATSNGSDTAPGEAMRNLLDDLTTSHQHSHVPNGGTSDYFESLDGMMVDWSTQW